MPLNPDDAQLCYLEAARLRDLANGPEYADIREQILRIANQYEALVLDNAVRGKSVHERGAGEICRKGSSDHPHAGS